MIRTDAEVGKGDVMTEQTTNDEYPRFVPRSGEWFTPWGERREFEPVETIEWEWVLSATGSGEMVPTLRDIAVHGHSADVVGSYPRTEDETGQITYTAASGNPTGWGTSTPDPTALPQTESRVRRSRKGRTTFIPSLYRPRHRRTTGLEYHLDHVTGEPACHVSCSNPDAHGAPIYNRRGQWIGGCDCNTRESALIAASDRILATQEDYSALRLIGDRVTHPDVTYADRGGCAEVTDWTYTRQPQFGPELDPTTDTYRHGTNPGTGALIVSNGDLGAWFGMSSLANAKHIRTNESSLTWPVRSTVPAANRLHSNRSLAIHGLAHLGTFKVQGIRGKVRVIGRKHADRTDIVTFADGGYFVGHAFHRSITARLARLAERRAERADGSWRQRMARRAETLHAAGAGRSQIATLCTPTVGTVLAIYGDSSTVPKLTDVSPLEVIRSMEIGHSLNGITRTAQGRWTNGSTVYDSPARAAMAMHKASVKV